MTSRRYRNVLLLFVSVRLAATLVDCVETVVAAIHHKNFSLSNSPVTVVFLHCPLYRNY